MHRQEMPGAHESLVNFLLLAHGLRLAEEMILSQLHRQKPASSLLMNAVALCRYLRRPA